MSYKAIPLGILLLLAVPAVSSAQNSVYYQVSASGTNFCNPTATNVKKTLFIGFLLGDVAFENVNVMAIANDQLFKDHIASLLQEEIFFTGNVLTTGAFMYGNNDSSGNVSAFAGTFKNDANGVLTSFTGTLNLTFQNGCFETLIIKSGPQVPPPPP